MQAVHIIFNGFFLPEFILGSLGYILMLVCERKQTCKILIAVLTCITVMFLWRLLCQTYNTSARYFENLFVFFSVESAFFLCYWHILFEKMHVKKEMLLFVRNILILVVCMVLFCFKYFHYNPHVKYEQKIAECIRNEKPVGNSAIISTKAQYPYDVPGIPQFTAPDFLFFDHKSFLLNIIHQYQLGHDTLYIVSDSPLKEYSLPAETLARISQIGCFRKNRRGQYLYVFKYHSPTLKDSLEASSAPYTLENQKNLFRNGGFETQYPHEGESTYYAKIQNSDKKGMIPESRFFPMSWDIFWSYGDTKKKNSPAFLYSEELNVISGQYSLAVKNSKTVSFLYESMFPKGDYLFQCDLRTASKSSFGLQLSLRDEKGFFFGMRELKRITLDVPGQLYHYRVRLTADMIFPFQNFYVYLFSYGQGDFLIDNAILTSITPENLE